MKKTVFGIWGRAKQGKSETVKEIAKEILAHHPSATSLPVHIDYSKDIQVIITIGKITIGIESQGDPGSRLFRSLDKFSAAKCDIIICSARSSGATFDTVGELHAKGYDIVWVTNHRSAHKDHAMLNDISAKHIYKLVEQTILGSF